MLMLNGNLTEEQRLTKAAVAIMGNPKYTALAGVMMIGDRRITDDPSVPTACTNGRDEQYGRAFVAQLNDAELRFLVLHEVYHKLYKHLTTWKHLYDENRTLANMACDYVINIKLVDDNKDGFATMTGALKCGCLDTKYRGWDSAKVYYDLKQNADEDEDEQGGGSGSGQGFDEHDWEGAAELTEDEQRELARELDEAIRQGALVAGKLGTGADRELEDLLRPQVDWREALRDFVTSTCAGSDYSTWKRPNRRYIGAGVYMPSGISERVEELCVAIDASGSIGGRALSAILSEVQSVAETVKPERVRLLYWDTSVAGDEKYEGGDIQNIVRSTKPKGGGGTDVACVPDYLRKHNINPQAVIVLTDGYLYGSWGQWAHPVLWCVLDNERAKPDVGKTVHINTRDM